MRNLVIFAALGLALPAQAQWKLLASNSTADFRGIDNAGNGVVWVSGSQGTILRSTDDGATWQPCATPPNGDKLDFRGIQAFGADRAVVMSSGAGDLSRIYTTTDGCKTWTLYFTAPDPADFFDAIQAPLHRHDDHPSLMILGDPIDGKFRLWSFEPFATGKKAVPKLVRMENAQENETIFAASNSSLIVYAPGKAFTLATGGRVARIITEEPPDFETFTPPNISYPPLGAGLPSSGIFSIATKEIPQRGAPPLVGKKIRVPFAAIAVGGDYKKPDDPTSVATYAKSLAAGYSVSSKWFEPKTPPHGYRSSVQYDSIDSVWITVGPNGTDVSTDDGVNWTPLRPSATDDKDADRNWNALGLPFVVGPHGRIGRLEPSAIKH